MRARVVAVVSVALVWVALWGEASAGNALVGLVVGAVLLAAFPDAPTRRRGLDAFRPLALLQFAAYFAWKVLHANAVVAWEVITPGHGNVNEGIVAVPLTGASDTVVTILANAISLTPGTLVLEVQREPTVLYVHVLHLRDIPRVRLDIFRLERMLVRAIGSTACLHDVETRIAELESGPSHPEEFR
jgi:multicomponent Na+:H+ antiporter subunit E